MFCSRLRKTGTIAVSVLFTLLLCFCAAAGIFDFMVPQTVTLYAGEDVYGAGLPGFVTLEFEEESVAAYAGRISDRHSAAGRYIPKRRHARFCSAYCR